jgi:hypothetical protein
MDYSCWKTEIELIGREGELLRLMGRSAPLPAAINAWDCCRVHLQDTGLMGMLMVVEARTKDGVVQRKICQVAVPFQGIPNPDWRLEYDCQSQFDAEGRGPGLPPSNACDASMVLGGTMKDHFPGCRG